MTLFTDNELHSIQTCIQYGFASRDIFAKVNQGFAFPDEDVIFSSFSIAASKT